MSFGTECLAGKIKIIQNRKSALDFRKNAKARKDLTLTQAVEHVLKSGPTSPPHPHTPPFCIATTVQLNQG